jgi:hypothetical protein
MSDPDRLISRDDKTFGGDATGFIVRVILVVSLGVLA